MAKMVMMVGVLAVGMDCMAANFGPSIPYLGRFLYDSETGSIRLGSVAFLIVLAVVVAWATKYDKKRIVEKERRRAAGEKGESALRKLCGCLMFIFCPLAFIAIVLLLIKLGVISKY